MHLKPEDLKLVALKDLPIGTLARFARRDDIPFVLRLTDKEDRPRVMLLGGSYSFEVTDWSRADDGMLVVCNREQLRFQLNNSDDTADFREPGVITLTQGYGYVIGAAKSNWNGPKIDLATLDAVQHERNSDADYLHFPDWELGKEDHRGDFVSLFKRERRASR